MTAHRLCADAGEAASAARPAGPSTLLEHSQNVVTAPDLAEFEISKCGCDCWYCPDCCERKGYNLRARLVPVLETFTGLMMLTLTIDPQLFPTPRAAYLWVKRKRGISRLMRELDRRGHLHSRRYFYVVEFQRETEQAHFHVLVDATRIPKPAIDAAWSRLRPPTAGPPAPNRPAFGMTRFSVPRFEGGAVHAARYATKYLVKAPESGWPDWVLAMGARVRVPRYQSSRGFWCLPPRPKASTGKPRALVRVSYAQRIAECGTACNVFEKTETINEVTGEVRPRLLWRGRIDLPELNLRRLSPHTGHARPRFRVAAATPGQLLQALRAATGIPVRVISGLHAGGAR
jgi:hypothetical protein